MSNNVEFQQLKTSCANLITKLKDTGLVTAQTLPILEDTCQLLTEEE